jgi:hypothetical protein
MILTAASRAERSSVCWRRTDRSGFVHPDTTVLLRQNSQWSLRFAPAEERDPAGKERDHEPPMATAAEATDMLRVGHSGVYRLIAASQRKSINIGRPQRASVASIRHVGATARRWVVKHSSGIIGAAESHGHTGQEAARQSLGGELSQLGPSDCREIPSGSVWGLDVVVDAWLVGPLSRPRLEREALSA